MYYSIQCTHVLTNVIYRFEIKKPCTFDIANVLMMKSEYGSFLSRVTLMPPYVSEPSSGQYWAHFFCIMLHNVHNTFVYSKETASIAQNHAITQCTFHNWLKRNIQYCAPISTHVSLLIKYFLHICSCLKARK